MNLSLWITVLLLLLNAFFVGAEFAAMAARRSQLEPLAAGGSRRAATCLQASEHMGSVLACAQLGITLCSVLLGAVSEAALHHVLEGPMERFGFDERVTSALALALALLIVVYLHVVVGEMIPKNLSISAPERAALVLVPPLYWLTRVLRPFISIMEGAAKFVVRRLGIEPKDEVSSAFTAEEVSHIVAESHREGLVEEEQYGLVGAALEFSDKSAGEVGIALRNLVTVGQDATPEQIERLVARHGFSRYPVTNASGELIGYLHLKDILYADEAQRSEPVPAKRIRRLATVARTDEVEDVLTTMQRTGSHVARVVDAEGVVRGVVFLEDVLEQLVGEVQDASQR
ncbi:hemolysin family protein [Nostocoides jenkinsii]|jgi:CBS domain containing-hemolysin-like protein|uniref:Hemolysin containing CBS domains protein n=1 Tax=Nostocoides jenkinsii Ben 74 TaxID=1193518 RepID=A0A077MBM8_9MICO|nr:hemolysin family protein [Tetrasphaera jenkinsii]CCI52068.1 Hemolysin containing CBS domains protein [Tetrasphaera jenkinsii Ben 74]